MYIWLSYSPAPPARAWYIALHTPSWHTRQTNTSGRPRPTFTTERLVINLWLHPSLKNFLFQGSVVMARRQTRIFKAVSTRSCVAGLTGVRKVSRCGVRLPVRMQQNSMKSGVRPKMIEISTKRWTEIIQLIMGHICLRKDLFSPGTKKNSFVQIERRELADEENR